MKIKSQNKNPLNPKLNKGDRITLIHMDGETSVLPGESGTVTGMNEVNRSMIYDVFWDNGSKLNLLEDSDKWMFEDDFKKILLKKKRKISESYDELNMRLYKRIPIIKHYDRRFIKKYLLKLRDVGLVNMLAAAPYLYIGRERLEHETRYMNITNEDAFEELLDMSDKAQSVMINGVISYLNEKGQELDINNINRELRRHSSEFVRHYVDILS